LHFWLLHFWFHLQMVRVLYCSFFFLFLSCYYFRRFLFETKISLIWFLYSLLILFFISWFFFWYFLIWLFFVFIVLFFLFYSFLFFVFCFLFFQFQQIMERRRKKILEGFWPFHSFCAFFLEIIPYTRLNHWYDFIHFCCLLLVLVLLLIVNC